MSRRRLPTGMAGTALVAAFFMAFLSTPTTGADFSATGDGSIDITVTVPAPPPQPFDWNWTYPAPTCDGVNISFPASLPASQQGVMEINVTGGSVSGMQYKLEGDAYKAAYPNGHAGKTVFIPWTDFRNNRIPVMGTWTVSELQVHGTNYHWRGKLTCGIVPLVQPNVVVASPEPTPSVVPEPAVPPATPPAAPTADPVVVPTPEATPVPTPSPQPAPQPTPQSDASSEVTEGGSEATNPEGIPSEDEVALP